MQLHQQFQQTGNMYGDFGTVAKELVQTERKRKAAAKDGGAQSASKAAKTPSKNTLAKAAEKKRKNAHAKPGVHIGSKVLQEWQSPESRKKTDHEGCAPCPKTTDMKPSVFLAGMCRHTMGCIGS